MGSQKIETAIDPKLAMRRLWTYFGPFRSRLYWVLLGVVAYTLLGLLGPYWMGQAIDQSIATRTPEPLARFALLMASAYFGSNAIQLFCNWQMASLSQKALQALRGDLFGNLQKLPIGFFDRRPPGELMSRLTSDVDAINQALAQNITSLVASVLSMLGIVIAMFALDPWLAMASLFVIPLMLGFTRFVAVYTRRGFREVQRSLGGLNAVMEETISGQKVVKAFRRNDSALARFREHNARVYETSVKANTYALLLMPLTGVLGNLFVIVLSGFGGWLALRGLVTIGIIATFINYSQNFIGPLRQLSNVYNMLQSALAGAERVFDTLSEPEEVDHARPQPDRRFAGDVRFEHVNFSYRPGMPVISDMSLHARSGDLVALVGPTGAGKTTIVNLLTRFYELESGSITLDGIDLREIAKSDLRRVLGIVLQETFLFSGSVRENIRYGRLDASDDEIVEAAKLAEADHFIRQLPNGYETVLSERGGNLSHGQRQLLAIARTLLADPTILILDEATSSVDTRTEVRIQRALSALMRGRTSFVVAHRLSTIRNAHQVLVVDGGRVVERGTHEELVERKGLYHDLFRHMMTGES
jgi:ATP-binding cassette subfamily B multidrug efflux pump